VRKKNAAGAYIFDGGGVCDVPSLPVLVTKYPSETPYRAFSEHVDKYFDNTIFSYKCKSWFKRNQDEGRIVGLWPGSSVHAQQALRNPRFEDFHYVHLPTARDNVLCWLGNGLTVAQKEEGNTTGYLDMVDIPPVINRGPQELKKGNDGHHNGSANVPLTELSSSAKNGLRSESNVNGNVTYVEDVAVEIPSVSVI
jgi:hypothetical protein